MPSDKKRLEKLCFRLWGNYVRKKYNRTCQWCGGKGNHAHHIFSRALRPTRFDGENGICLCLSCHIFKLPQHFEKFRREVLIPKLGMRKYNRLYKKAYSKPQKPIDLEVMRKRLEKLNHGS